MLIILNQLFFLQPFNFANVARLDKKIYKFNFTNQICLKSLFFSPKEDKWVLPSNSAFLNLSRKQSLS